MANCYSNVRKPRQLDGVTGWWSRVLEALTVEFTLIAANF